MGEATIICVCSAKGGVGKSTLCRTCGAILRSEFRQRVLFVDLASNATLTRSLGAAPSEGGAYELIASSKSRAEDCIIRTQQGEEVITAASCLNDLPLMISKRYRLQEQSLILRAKLEPIAGDYDFIIIDTPTAINAVHLNALVSADYVIMAADADRGSIDALQELAVSINEARAANPSLAFAGVVMSLSDRTTLCKVVKELLDKSASDLFGAAPSLMIRKTSKMGEARLMQQSIIEYAPRCTAADDYRKLCEELLKLKKNPKRNPKRKVQ